MTTLLQVRDVVVHFGGVIAVQDVSFDVESGELLGLIGPNGAGKTTMMRVITGVVTAQSGTVVLDGQDVTTRRVHVRVRLGMGHSHQLVRPFKTMTLLENVALAAGFAKTRAPLRALALRSRADERRRALELLKLLGIADAADSSPATLPLCYL